MVSEHGEGCVVLAAYRPETTAFTAQLQSIAMQTVRSWQALVVPDSDADQIRSIVASAVPGDERFVVLDYAGHQGFLRTFERGLAAVPPAASWIALADQDDVWYPQKLEELLPVLRSAALVSGQAVVTGADGNQGAITRRRSVPLDGILVDNQVTGSFSVLRRELLEVALPFPDAPEGAFHDHWLGVCAMARGGVVVVDRPLQQYVQHGANVIGEARPERLRVRLQRLAGDGLGRAIERLVRERLGWRRTMARTALERCPATPESPTLRRWSVGRWTLARAVAQTVRAGHAPVGRAAGLLLAIALEPLALRHNIQRRTLGSPS